MPEPIFDPKDVANNPIVILGMPRSGAAAVAGALSRLGVFLGPEEDFIPADDNNAAGYYESRALTEWNQSCMAWLQIQAGSTRPITKHWEEHPATTPLVEGLKRLLVERFAVRPVWGFRQSEAIFALEVYQRAFAELGLQPHYVICVRNPVEVKASEHALREGPKFKRIGRFGSKSASAWLDSLVRALRLTENEKRTIVPYDQFLKEPSRFLRAIMGDNLSASGADWDAANRSVQKELCHHIATLDAMTRYPELARRLFTWCCDPVGSPEAILDEFESWKAILRPQGLSGTQLGFAWEVGGQVRTAQVPILPSGYWQTIQFKINAPPKTLLNGLLYSQACRVWIRKGAFVLGPEKISAKITPGPGSNLGSVGGTQFLDGAYEPRQVNLSTPSAPGPYTLELEIWLEAGIQVSKEAASRTTDRLYQSSARLIALQQKGVRP